jgi:hypothetical protein
MDNNNRLNITNIYVCTFSELHVTKQTTRCILILFKLRIKLCYITMRPFSQNALSGVRLGRFSSQDSPTYGALL